MQSRAHGRCQCYCLSCLVNFQCTPVRCPVLFQVSLNQTVPFPSCVFSAWFSSGSLIRACGLLLWFMLPLCLVVISLVFLFWNWRTIFLHLFFQLGLGWTIFFLCLLDSFKNLKQYIWKACHSFCLAKSDIDFIKALDSGFYFMLFHQDELLYNFSFKADYKTTFSLAFGIIQYY